MADSASVDSRLFFARFNLSTPFAPDITHFKALSVLCENSLLFPFMFVDKKFRQQYKDHDDVFEAKHSCRSCLCLFGRVAKIVLLSVE